MNKINRMLEEMFLAKRNVRKMVRTAKKIITENNKGIKVDRRKINRRKKRILPGEIGTTRQLISMMVLPEQKEELERRASDKNMSVSFYINTLLYGDK